MDINDFGTKEFVNKVNRENNMISFNRCPQCQELYNKCNCEKVNYKNNSLISNLESIEKYIAAINIDVEEIKTQLFGETVKTDNPLKFDKTNVYGHSEYSINQLRRMLAITSKIKHRIKDKWNP